MDIVTIDCYYFQINKLIVLENLGVYIFNSTAGSLISCYTITGVTGRNSMHK